jgi:hypothetical protein
LFYLSLCPEGLSKRGGPKTERQRQEGDRKALKFVIFVDYPKLTALAEYLKGVATISNTLNIPIPWILPTGLVINQQFYDKNP